MDNIFDEAAKAAWNDDWLSCPKCGNMYGSDMGPCECEEECEEDEEVE